jgi:hypothetical protein
MRPQMVQTIERHEIWMHSVVAMKPVASSSISIMTKMTVGFTTCAALQCGWGTIYKIVFNRVLMVVIGVAHNRVGMHLQLWSFVAPHGFLRFSFRPARSFALPTDCFPPCCRAANP